MTAIAEVHIPELDTRIDPVSALLLYQIERRVIATLHPLKSSRRGHAVIGAGRPCTQSDVQDVLELLAGLEPSRHIDWLPPELLAQGEDYRVWWTPGKVRPMWFLCQDKRLGLRVPWPTLLWLAHKKTLWCAALAKNARPSPASPLYHAPLMNIDAQGQVCIGTAAIPSEHSAESQAVWEAILFESNFSHANHQETLKRKSVVSTEQQLSFWQSQAGKKRFPVPVLNPMETTVQDWLDEVLS
ncbi:MAG: PRTRC system protein B [Candidatus Competibacteraceae bacterium]|nr:PRTRC system protein B [Candidatus Competibacteraceae bacterium]